VGSDRGGDLTAWLCQSVRIDMRGGYWTETANEALDTLDEQARAELPALVAGLVTDVSADPLTGAPVPVVAALDRKTFEAQKAARKALVEAFVGKRLLTAEGDGVSRRVRPVHEALLRIWPQAVAIVGETASLIRVRHTLEPMVREWFAASPSAKPDHLEISPARSVTTCRRRCATSSRRRRRWMRRGATGSGRSRNGASATRKRWRQRTGSLRGARLSGSLWRSCSRFWPAGSGAMPRHSGSQPSTPNRMPRRSATGHDPVDQLGGTGLALCVASQWKTRRCGDRRVYFFERRSLIGAA
jgi:hypothetical protein